MPTWFCCFTAQMRSIAKTHEAGKADIILGKHRNGPTANITVAHQLHFSRFTNMAR